MEFPQSETWNGRNSEHERTSILYSEIFVGSLSAEINVMALIGRYT